ncbi:MAG: response regulator transcription factor [Spirulina sp. SIO3F2]|nr:response regulator transcription factor [Spirulina sp. SIO3F2]
MKRILIVDDDTQLRESLRDFFLELDYQVEDFTSGSVALQQLQQQPPDLILSDVTMPEMDGWEFCRQVRAIPAGQLIPFIFLSAKDDLKDRVKGHEIGADDYLTKPFAMRELRAKVEAQLERSRRINAEIVRMMQQIRPATTETAPPEQPPALPLTPAEERVFWEVMQGNTNKQISANLFISPRTVQSHLSNILSKLDLENRSQLVRYAYERGYRPPE